VARRLQPEDLAAVTGWLAAQPLPANPRAIDSLPAPTPIECGRAALPAGSTR
jgi:hypothetical protein